ncbi:uncharacterized protein CIMG_09532 [Coccidioides immitis RS]|uniref:Uncharacterized protein n=1 Tax=Coccidioides immitis (strain RS) TaxID=246410 RepID=J3K2K6_COCIM|nr:uncharacterized protein CIMG_09532 [Coccidioides immitis RS]EAS28328.3 hypothetical protein CIMG_09532 [Coccidioides immitis RS]
MKLGGRAGVVSGHAGRREDAEPPRPPPRQTKGDASSWIPYSWAGRERERGCESTAGEETMTGERKKKRDKYRKMLCNISKSKKTLWDRPGYGRKNELDEFTEENELDELPSSDDPQVRPGKAAAPWPEIREISR